MFNFKGTWIEGYADENHSNFHLYQLAIYWAVQTMTTVGYGDMPSQNTAERNFGSAMMVIGVVAFTFANGAFTSIISTEEHLSAELREDLETLDRIYSEYQLPLDLYNRIRKSIHYDHIKDFQNLQNFIYELPVKLQTEVSLYVYEGRYQNINFFLNQEVQVIVWMCPLLKPQILEEYFIIHTENDKVDCIYFLINGLASFVLPKYRYVPYININ